MAVFLGMFCVTPLLLLLYKHAANCQIWICQNWMAAGLQRRISSIMLLWSSLPMKHDHLQ